MKSKICINCSKKLPESWSNKGCLWCDMNCKKDFLLKYYSKTNTLTWFMQKDKALKASKKRVLAEIKKSGLTVTEYIHCLLYTSPSPRDRS